MWKRLPIHYFLSYLETGGADTSIRPWFWLFWLFLGPIVRNLCFQWYIFIATRTLVRTEALLTQLVFEHSLRIRLKAEASNEKIEDDNVTVIGTQDSASVIESTTADSNSLTGEAASQSSQASSPTPREDSSSDSQSTSKGPVKAKDSSTPKSDAKSATKDKKETQNLIGKINNLVTADLGNIVDGRDFLTISMLSTSILNWVRCLIILQVLYVPLQSVFCTVFLYEVLGWRSAYLPTSYNKKKKSHLSFRHKCICWTGYNGRLVSSTWIYCKKSSRRTSSEDEKGIVVSKVSSLFLT